MLVALVLWPLRPYRPVRLAVAAAYRALADYADEVAAASRSGEGVTNPPRVRVALETARAALATVRRGRPGESGRGERLVVLGETADQLFGQLFGLSDVAESTPVEARDPAAQAALAEAVTAFAGTVRAIADAIEAEEKALPVSVTWQGDALRARLSATTSPDGVEEARLHYQQAAGLLDRLAQYAGVAATIVAGLNSGAPDSSAGAGKGDRRPRVGAHLGCAAPSGAVVGLGGAALRAPGGDRHRRGRRAHGGAGPQARLLDHHHRGDDPAALHRHHQRPGGAAGARHRRRRDAHGRARRALP